MPFHRLLLFYPKPQLLLVLLSLGLILGSAHTQAASASPDPPSAAPEWRLTHEPGDQHINAVGALPPRIWSQQVGGREVFMRKMVVNRFGDLYIGGHTDQPYGSPALGKNDAFITRYDQDGNLVWIKRFGSANSDSLSDMAIGPKDRIYATGTTIIFDDDGFVTDNNAWVAVFSSEGEMLWREDFGGSNNDFANGIGVTLDGDIYIAGETGCADFSNSGWLVRYAKNSGRSTKIGRGDGLHLPGMSRLYEL